VNIDIIKVLFIHHLMH